MSMLLGAVIALGVLVTFHELGHFWVARLCGVEVIRFSIGFGKPLIRWRDRHGTEFVIAMIPLGGYVKMLDSREAEAEIPPEKQQGDFIRKPVRQRLAIVAAGPIANFILAFILFWAVALIGSKEPIPLIGKIEPDSAIAKMNIKSGTEIVSIDGVLTPTLGDVAFQLFNRLGETGTIILVTKEKTGHEVTYQLPINNWQRGVERPNPFAGLGFKPFYPAFIPRLKSIQDGSPAQKAGLQAGDLLRKFDEKPVVEWKEVLQITQSSPNKTISIELERSDRILIAEVTLAQEITSTGSVGRLGVEVEMPSWPESMQRQVRSGVVSALGKAAKQTWAFSTLTIVSVKKMLTGEMSAKNLSGPITIAKVAGSSVDSGLVSFLKFLALFSVSLGVFNLLPIPVLDGGHLLFYAIEGIFKRPIPERVQGAALQLGVFLMLGIMLFAIMNDLS